MITGILLTFLIIAGVAGVAVLALRQRFTAHLDALDAKLRNLARTQAARSDLPAEVIALAMRMGARADGASEFAAFEQLGQMWKTPGGKPADFRARQIVRVDAPGFLWRASMGPIMVADYFVDGIGGLEVRLLGAFAIAQIVGGADAAKGEALRYLAEVPWCPDAIFFNRSLDWTVIDAKTIKVATGVGAERGEVTFDLDDNGLIVRASAPSRLYAEKGRTTSRPWRGRFWDYQLMGGRLMPLQGEVAWGLDTGDFVYWRGHMLSWSGSPAPARTP